MSQAPSFGSFPGTTSNDGGAQPSFSSFPDAPKHHVSRKDKSRKDEDAADRHKHKKRKHESKHPPSIPKASVSTVAPAQKHPETPLQAQLAVYPRRSKPTSATPITSDTAGDPDFIRYRTINAADVPRFRRTGAGRVLGTARGLKIVKTQQGSRKALTLLPSNQKRLVRYTDKDQTRKLLAKDRKVYQLLPGQGGSARDQSENSNAPFVRLLEEDIEKPLDPFAEPEYKDMGDAPSASGSDSNSGEEDDANGTSVLGQGRSYLDRLTFKKAELSTTVREHPDNIQAWLDFVAHQDVFLSNTRANFDLESDHTSGAIGRTSKRRHREREERRAIAETKLVILGKALSKNKDAVELIRERLRVGETIWTRDELAQEWERALRKAEEGPRNALWRDWSEWHARESREFRVKELVGAAQEAIGNLKSFEHRLAVFDKTARCLRAGAYTERANALYQALMELHFFCPARFAGYALQEKLEELDLYWNADTPRFGTPGALGWAHTDVEDPPSSTPESKSSSQKSNLPLDPDSGPYARWSVLETEAAADHRYAKTFADQQEDEEDIYSYILFESDLAPLLFGLDTTSESFAQQRQDLLFSYLSFIGVETLQSGQCTNDAVLADDILSSKATGHFFPPPYKSLNFEVIGGEPMEASRQSGLKTPADGWGRHWPVMHELLLPSVDPGWPTQWKHQDWDAVDMDLIRASLQQILAAGALSPDMSRFLKIFGVSIEVAYDEKGAAKVAKSSLAADSRHLLMWDAYARLEASRGKIKEVRRVYQQTAAALHTFPSDQQSDVSIFWYGWAELEWQLGNHDRALQVLAASIEAPSDSDTVLQGPSLTSAQLARARQTFSNRLQALRSSSLDTAHAVVASAALFAYLTEGLKPACAIFEECCYDARPVPAFQERLYIMYCKLLYQQTQREAYQPGLLRDVLIDALAQFPSNSLFLNLLFQNESRTRIQNRVRSLLDKQLSTSQSTDARSWIFRIFVELHIDARGYGSEAVLHLFEQAVSALQTRPSVALWQLFLHFAILQQDAQLIRSVMLRAVVECPTSKELYMLVFYKAEKLAYSRRDLKELYRSMQEKDIRLFTSIKSSESIEDLDFGLPADDQGDEVDEALRDLADKQGLMPY